MRLCRLVFLMAAFYASTLLNAQTVGSTFNSTDGKMTYTVTAIGSTNTVSVGKLGNPVGSITIPDTVNYNSKTFLVTEIDYSAFTRCIRIDTVTIGKNIAKIGDEAFYGCDSITEINFNATNCADIRFHGDTYETVAAYAFLFNSKELFTLNIGSNVQRIPSYIFHNQQSLKAVNFKDVSSCKEIASCAFSRCSNKSFTKLVLPDSIQTIGISAFGNCTSITSLTLGKGLKQIKDHAFPNLNELDTLYFNATSCEALFWEAFNSAGDSTFCVVIGKNVTKIPDRLFNNCNMLGSITFESGSTCLEIGASAFYNATRLSAISIPDCITKIGMSAFYQCTGLTEISLPKSVTIANNAFTGCTGLFIVDNENPNYSAADGVLYDKIQSTLIACPSSLSGLFSIPESVTSIGANAFFNCSLLTSILIPSSVTTIGEGAFNSCKKLHAVSIPNSVDSIGDMAFHGCENLIFYISQRNIPPKLGGSYVFNGMPSNAMLFVPFGSKNQYDAAFGAYFNPSNAIIEGKPFQTTSGIDYMISDTILKTASVFKLSPTYSDIILNIPSTIQYNSETYAVTSIGSNAFWGCTNLMGVSIPNSVREIGDYAFFGCTNLHSIIIPDSVVSVGIAAFKNCTGLDSCSIGNGINSINVNAFQNCTALTSCILGNSVNAIDDYAFQNCSVLKSIVIPDSTQSIGSYAFTNCSSLDSCIIGKTVTDIGNNAFQNCTALRSIVIPDSIKTLNNSVFQNCTALQYCIIGKAITTINDSAFQACSALKSIVLPDSVKFVGPYAFSSCSSLDSLDLGAGITNIGIYAFESCIQLTNVTIPESVTTIGVAAFSSCSKIQKVNFNASQCSSMGTAVTPFYNCTVLTTIHLGDKATMIPDFAFSNAAALTTVTGGHSIKRIGDKAFYSCTKLGSIVLPDSLTFIGNDAFYRCNELRNITLGKFIDSVGTNAFSNCGRLQSVRIEAVNCRYMGSYSYPVFNKTNINSVTIDDSVTSLANLAFYKCSYLNSITMESSTPPTLGGDVFTNISSTAKLYVPSGSKTNYVNYNSTNNYTRFFSSAGTTDGSRIIELAPTAINNPADASVSITETSDGLVVIQCNNELSGTISVYNMAGLLQTTCSLSGERTVLPSRLESGVYLAVLQTNGRRKTVKIRID